MIDEKKPPRSAPLAACGVILAAMALVGLAHGYDRSRRSPEEAPATPDVGGAAAASNTPGSDPGSDSAGSDSAGSDSAGSDSAGSGNVARLLEGQPLDLNRATAEELELLPRIGPTLARRIIEDRERRGPFRSVGELTRVRGIGPRTLEGIVPLATASVTDP